MSMSSKVRRALAEGGPRELVRRARVWAARGIHPGPLPEAPAPARRRARPRPPATRLRAVDVEHTAALAWFERRRATYEELAAAVAPYVARDGVYFDIGANIGFFTSVLAERTGFRGTVHLFEPVPRLAALCEVTLADAPFTAHVHNYALGAEDGTTQIYLAGDGNLGWNTLVAEKTHAEMSAIDIQIRTLAGTGVADVPSFVKIDVEGAEYLVLAGLLPVLASWPVKPVILCEIGWGAGHPQWDEELAVFDRLAALGYHSRGLDGEPVDLRTLTRTTDVLFVP